MAQIKKLSTELQPLDKLLDSSGDAGTSGQILSSTGSGTNWISASSGTITGSGTTGYIPKWTGSSALGDSILEVNSALPSSVIIPEYIRHRGDTNTYFGFHSNDTFIVATNNNEVMRVTSAGNVGIGTTSPGTNLQVNSSANTATSIGISNTGSGASRLYMDASNGDFSGSDYMWIGQNDDKSGEIFMAQNSGSFHIKTQPGGTSTTQFTVTQAGNVGIGTTSPQAALHVAGAFDTTAPTGDGVLMGSYNSAYGAIQLNGTSGSFIDFSTSGTDHKGRILYNNSTNYLRFDTNGTEKVRILSSGNVGIGTSSPSTKLHVYNGEATIASSTDGVKLSYSNGNSSGVIDTAFSDNALEFRTNGTSKMFIANAGNVGIGTTSPAEKLEVNGSIKLGSMKLENISAGGRIGFNRNTSTGAIYNSSYEAFQIQANGAGYLETQVYSSSGTYIGSMVLTDDVKLGIGLTGPNERLEVSGNIRASGSYKVGATDVISSGRRFFAADGSDSAPAYSFSGRTDTGIFVDDHGSNDRMFFSLDGTARAYIDSNGISSNATIYVSTAGSFRNYSGVWRATTGTSGNGFQFFNTADNSSAVLLSITSVSSAATDSVATFSGKVKSAQTTNSDGNDILTTKSYVDGLVTGVTRYMGLWDARTSAEGGSGAGGSPDLTTSTYKVPGYYFIVSHEGTATPNGAGTEPNTWHVGDWVIWSDQATDAWQKIDNTSVLSGAGTANKVAMWNGDESLTNAPITISSNDSTFAGNVESQDTFILNYNNAGNKWQQLFDGANGWNLRYYNGSSWSSNYINVNTSGNATFAGSVEMASGKITSDGSAAAGAYLELKHPNNNSTDVCATINLTNNAGGYAAIVGGTTGANNTGYIEFKTDNAGTQGTVLTLNADNSATFAAQVNVGTKLLMNNNQELRWKDSGGTERTMLELDSSNNTYLGTSAGGNLYLVNGSSYTTAVTIDSSQNTTFAGTIDSKAITALAKGTQLGTSGYYINSTFKDTGDNVGVFLAHNDTANGTGAIAGINQLAFLTYGSAWTQALLLDSSQNATFAGSLTIDGNSSSFDTGNNGTFVTNDTNNYPRITVQGASAQLGLFRSNNNVGGMYIGGASDGFRIWTESFSPRFHLDQSGNATFSGSVHLDSDSAQLQFSDDNDMQIFHNGSNGEINNSTGDFTIDSAGDITLDAGGADIFLKDDGTEFGLLANTSNNLVIMSRVQDKDIIFKGNDDGSTISALTLDMSDGGKATFNNGWSSDGEATQYTWRLPSTGTNSNYYYKIARVTSNQSCRFKLEMVGGFSYSDNYYSSEINAYGQLNNDNNYDLIYHRLEKEAQSGDPIITFGQVDVDNSSTDLYVQIGNYSELVITASISQGDLYPEATSTGSSTAPTNFVAATEQFGVLSPTKFQGTVRFNSQILDKDSNAGTSGQLLSSTGSQVDWVDASAVIGGPYLPLAGGAMTGNIDMDNNNLIDVGDFNIPSTLTIQAGGDITVAGSTTFQQSTDFEANSSWSDNSIIRLGTSNDLQIWHDGSNSKIKNTGGHLKIGVSSRVAIQNDAYDENIAEFIKDGAVNLYYDNSSRLSTAADGITVGGVSSDITFVNDSSTDHNYLKVFVPDATYNILGISQTNVYIPVALEVDGAVTFNNDVDLQDNDKLKIGSGNDLQLYHDGSNSYIKETGTGVLYIQGSSNVQIEGANGENMVTCNENGSVQLYYNNVQKFQTTSSGIGVTGYYGFGSGGTSTGSSYYYRYGSVAAGSTQGLIITTSDTGGSYFDGVAQFRNTNTSNGANMFQMINYGNQYSRYINFFRGSTSNIIGYIGYNATNTAVTYSTSSSDIRTKKNIVTWDEEVLPKFLTLQPKKFDFKASVGDKGESKVKGFIAQYETENFPEVYQLNGEGEDARYGFHPMEMIPYLMKAVKELAEKNKDLETRLAALEK